MDIEQLCGAFLTQPRQKALDSAVSDHGRSNTPAVVSLYNLAGSSAAVALTGVKRGKAPLLVIGDSRDDAGYLYHDFSRILGQGSVLIFPSAYKRDIKYGQIDPPSQVARTEVLTAWHTDSNLKVVVTYPDAIAECVATRDSIATHTLNLSLSSTADLVEIQKWLRTNGFAEVDYVYEPGQFAVRGSIIDIFSYSNDLPYRIDFIGDEIDSMRVFEVETQLSRERVESVAVTANVERNAGGTSLLEFINPETVIAVRDAAFTVDRIKAIASETFSDSAMIADEGDSNALSHVIDPEKFDNAFATFTR